jgi:hypothetical protein
LNSIKKFSFLTCDIYDKKTEHNIYKTKQISDIDDEVMAMHSKLKAFSKGDFLKCLEKFVDNYDFIEWIRQATKSKRYRKYLSK